MIDKKKLIDPHAEREAANYDNPIPSREYILALLNAGKTPVPFFKLVESLALETPGQQQALQYRLGAMIRDRQISQNRKGAYLIVDKSSFVTGTVAANREGFGFVLVKDRKEDIFLNAREMRQVFDGDEVKVAIIHTKKNGKSEGEIIEVTARNTHYLAGRVEMIKGSPYLIPENPKIHQRILIDPPFHQNIDPQDIVSLQITQQPERRSVAKGIVTEILGKHADPGMEITLATRNFDIPHHWPEDAMAELDKLKDKPSKADIGKRIDLRDRPFVTIDGEDARDFDDAVYCERKKGGGWRLFVAIADVSHYVSVGSALDREAHERGTSVYFPESVLPMLPEKISNGLCSLMPQVDRLSMICEMTISARGRLSGYRFYEGVIHSHARLTYNLVGDMLSGKSKARTLARKQYQSLMPAIDELFALYQTLRSQRTQRGAMDFETVETRIVFGPSRKIEKIVPVIRNEAHKIIEECMLCANVAAARFLEKHNIPTLYRVHQGPTEKKLGTLREYLAENGLSLKGGNKPKTSDYQSLLQSIASRDDAHLVQTMVLRSMSQAVYEPDNGGHFGLAYPAYTHFTSPIRRYPDLLVHRAIRSVIRSDTVSRAVLRHEKQKKLIKKKIYPYDEAALVQLGEHCSMTERRADDATRDVVNWLKCEYLSHFIGQTFEGLITAITGFGFFVELTDLYVEGLVHISTLDNDFFHFDIKKQRLIGENSRRTFKLGDSVEVLVSKVELDERRIHLLVVEDKKPKRKRKRNPSVKAETTGKKKKTSVREQLKTGKLGAKTRAGKKPSRKKTR